MNMTPDPSAARGRGGRGDYARPQWTSCQPISCTLAKLSIYRLNNPRITIAREFRRDSSKPYKICWVSPGDRRLAGVKFRPASI